MHPVKVTQSRADEAFSGALQHKRQLVERMYRHAAQGMCPGMARLWKDSEAAGAVFVVSLMLVDFSLDQLPFNAEDSVALQRVENELIMRRLAGATRGSRQSLQLSVRRNESSTTTGGSCDGRRQ
jgi:hypothetical protein